MRICCAAQLVDSVGLSSAVRYFTCGVSSETDVSFLNKRKLYIKIVYRGIHFLHQSIPFCDLLQGLVRRTSSLVCADLYVKVGTPRGEGFVKCLEFIAGVSFARLALSTCSLFFALSCSFVPFACLFGNPVFSARFLSLFLCH